jgi:hypothetical protein
MGCFPNDAIVKTPKGKKQCCELELNDMVLVDGGKYEKIVCFSHFDTQTESSFIKITLRNGKRVRATKSHLIMVNNKEIKSFDSVVVGDKLKYKQKFCSVMSIEIVSEKGLICPITESGSIVVDNVLCTCYASWFAFQTLPSFAKTLSIARSTINLQRCKRILSV